jgi:hypothetical protein
MDALRLSERRLCGLRVLFSVKLNSVTPQCFSEHTQIVWTVRSLLD